MPYPRTNCPVCGRDVAVYPLARIVIRHDPEVRDLELKSCPGSFRRQPVNPEAEGHQETFF